MHITFCSPLVLFCLPCISYIRGSGGLRVRGARIGEHRAGGSSGRPGGADGGARRQTGRRLPRRGRAGVAHQPRRDTRGLGRQATTPINNI